MAVPVTLLSGTLGAGKTTLVNHVLSENHPHEPAVLVNDLGEINVDADLVERRLDGDREVVELSNGCICCGIRSDFERAVVELALSEEFDHLLVEPSGISEPAPIARQFVRGRAAGLYDLASVTTVIDARQFYDAFGKGEVRRRGESEGDRPLSDLIVDGVEFCDALVVNKTDLVTDDELDEIRETLRTLQPEAELFTTEYGRLEPANLLGVDRFDIETVSESAGWKRALNHADEHGHGEHDHDSDDTGSESTGHTHHTDDDHDDHDDHEHEHRHPPEVYGVDSFVYRRWRPMHPERLAGFLRSLPEGVIRAKGWLHVAGRPDLALTLSVAGPQASVEVAGRWIASLPEARRTTYRERRNPEWNDEYGDRQTKLVVIGRGMDRAEIERRLDDCVLTDRELSEGIDGAANPFPANEGAVLDV